jgi:hypothetical protein
LLRMIRTILTLGSTDGCDSDGGGVGGESLSGVPTAGKLRGAFSWFHRLTGPAAEGGADDSGESSSSAGGN